MIKVALDAMGGDNAPDAVVEGAVLAAREAAGRYGIVLTGPEEVITPLLVKYGGTDLGIEVFHAPDLVAMDDSPAAVTKCSHCGQNKVAHRVCGNCGFYGNLEVRQPAE